MGPWRLGAVEPRNVQHRRVRLGWERRCRRWGPPSDEFFESLSVVAYYLHTSSGKTKFLFSEDFPHACLSNGPFDDTLTRFAAFLSGCFTLDIVDRGRFVVMAGSLRWADFRSGFSLTSPLFSYDAVFFWEAGGGTGAVDHASDVFSIAFLFGECPVPAFLVSIILHVHDELCWILDRARSAVAWSGV